MTSHVNLSAELEAFEAECQHRLGRPDLVEIAAGIEDPLKRLDFYLALLPTVEENLRQRDIERTPPVDAQTFLSDPYYLGGNVSLWPRLKAEILKACSGQYVEAVFTGSIGTGKTTAALLVQVYYLYRLMNLRSPHQVYQLDPSSEIAFVMQSITGGTAYTVDYMRLRRMIENCPWFRDYAPHEKDRKATIQFKNSAIFVQPLPGTETAAIGENVFGGIIDEVNHMKVIRNSSRKADNTVHDQMLENYRAIARRRESRFQRMGQVPGMLCLVGSANYAGQFTDRKREERDRQLERDGETSIYIFDKRPWEVQPDDRFSTSRFRVFLGDGTRKPRILGGTEIVAAADAPYIMPVPDNYLNAFEADLSGAVKDIAGIALHGFSNFIGNFGLLVKAFGSRKNIFAPDWCDFGNQSVSIPAHQIPMKEAPRYIHIDLSLSLDYAALVMGYCSGFAKIDRGGGMTDMMPKIALDGMLSIRPTSQAQIPIWKIKKLVFALKQMGYNIKWVSLDGFQSADFIQTMVRSGMSSGVVSLDRTPDPYLLTKQIILDECLSGPPSELARKEFHNLVWVSQNTKVDHPPDGSKDLSDATAGVCYGLATKREIWARYGVNPAHSSIMVKTKEIAE